MNTSSLTPSAIAIHVPPFKHPLDRHESVGATVGGVDGDRVTGALDGSELGVEVGTLLGADVGPAVGLDDGAAVCSHSATSIGSSITLLTSVINVALPSIKCSTSESQSPFPLSLPLSLPPLPSKSALLLVLPLLPTFVRFSSTSTSCVRSGSC